MIVVWMGLGESGTVLGWQCVSISVSAIIAVLVVVLILSVVEKDLSYRARRGALPTLPNRWVVVKEHFPARRLACSGDIDSVLV